MGLDCLSRHRQAIADGLVRSTFGHQGQDFALALRQVVERDARASANKHRHNRGIAGSGEILVSDMTRQLCGGSEQTFEDLGEVELRGLEGARRIFGLEAQAASADA